MIVVGNMATRILMLSLFLVIICSITFGNKVIELSERFLEVSKDGLWFVMFYAPWCGHCKKLEPIWNQVGQSLHYSSIRVGKVDCTRFSSVATEYNIQGFPTILFMKGEKIYTYKGDRVREDILEFAKRLEGPPVRVLQNEEELQKLRNLHKVFFLIETSNRDDAGSDLWRTYHDVAEKFQESNYFYSLFTDVKFQKLEQKNQSTEIFVYKDDKRFNFQFGNTTELNVTLIQWILRERFPSFIKVTQGTLPSLLKTEKFLVIAVLEENLVGRYTRDMEEFRDKIKAVAQQYHEEFKEFFIFGWMSHPSIANSVAMQQLEVPSLLVIDSGTYQYYLPEDDISQLTSEAIITFLNGIRNHSISGQGGNGFFTRIYRVYYDGTTTLSQMWYGNPVLTTVLFGLPLGFLLLIFYSICCSNILDASDEGDAEEEESAHEKNE